MDRWSDDERHDYRGAVVYTYWGAVVIPIWLLVFLILGINFTLWGAIGLLRFGDARIGRRSPRKPGAAPADDKPGGASEPPRRPVALVDVAVLMAAHNEEVVIEDSLTALTKLVPAAQVFIVSDASTDRTVGLARGFGVNVTETSTNVGKATALSQGIARFALIERFNAVLLLDADTRLDPNYFDATLPVFDDAEVVAVAGCAHSHWPTSGVSFAGRLLLAHRSRVYALTQRLLKYGQTWRLTNRTHIVPGFASLYRTDILGELSIDAPDLVIEDFNMTFEVYRKRLGRIGFALDGIAVTQDPYTLRDYTRQTKRWALGLWQTVRRHRLHLDLFSLMLGLLLFELICASVLLLLLPFIILILVVPDLIPQTLDWSGAATAHAFVAGIISLQTIAIGVLLPDYLLTCVTAIVERRPRYLFYGIFFVFIRIIDASLALYTLPRAWQESSTGRWVSPTRRDPLHGVAKQVGPIASPTRRDPLHGVAKQVGPIALPTAPKSSRSRSARYPAAPGAGRLRHQGRSERIRAVDQMRVHETSDEALSNTSPEPVRYPGESGESGTRIPA